MSFECLSGSLMKIDQPERMGKPRPSLPFFYISRQSCHGRQGYKFWRYIFSTLRLLNSYRSDKEQGGTMGISISGVGSGVNFVPAPELPIPKADTVQQKAVIQQFEASLPGSNRQSGYTPHKIRQTAADIERISQTLNKKLQFVVDSQSNEVIVKVIDKTTDKVIKVLPPEELQRLHRKLKETIGFSFNEYV